MQGPRLRRLPARFERRSEILIGVRESTPAFLDRLQCVECDRVSRENERGWTAYLTTDEDEPASAIVYCPECTEREFGVNLLDAAISRPVSEPAGR